MSYGSPKVDEDSKKKSYFIVKYYNQHIYYSTRNLKLNDNSEKLDVS